MSFEITAEQAFERSQERIKEIKIQKEKEIFNKIENDIILGYFSCKFEKHEINKDMITKLENLGYDVYMVADNITERHKIIVSWKK